MKSLETKTEMNNDVKFVTSVQQRFDSQEDDFPGKSFTSFLCFHFYMKTPP